MLKILEQLERQGCHFVLCGDKEQAESPDKKTSANGKAPHSFSGVKGYTWKDHKPSAKQVWDIVQQGRVFGIVPSSLGCVVQDVDGGDTVNNCY